MPDHNLLDRPVTLAAAPPRVRRRWLWAVLLLLPLGAAGAWWATHRPAPVPVEVAAPAPSLTVSLRPVERRALLRPVVGDGTIAAWQELVVGAEAGGLRVVEAALEPGERVRAGQVLLRLDPAIPASLLAQADAALAEAEAALRLAESELRRAGELTRTDSVARATVESREALARQAAARLLGARARREEAAARLAQTRIASPHDGTISRRSVLVGAVLQPGQELFRLIRDDRLELDVRVPELELARVEVGQAVRVLHGEREVAGARVRAIFPTVEGATRLGTVHVALPPGSGLRPGQFARAEIGAGSPPALTVPQEAVVFRGGRAVTFVLPPGAERVEARPVSAGMRREGLVEITAGLAEGERVVAQGAGFLGDGDRVRAAPN